MEPWVGPEGSNPPCVDPLGMEPTEAPAMACCSPSKNHSTLAVTGQALPTHHGTTPQGPGPPSQGHHTPLQPTKGVLGPMIYCVNTFCRVLEFFSPFWTAS